MFMIRLIPELARSLQSDIIGHQPVPALQLTSVEKRSGPAGAALRVAVTCFRKGTESAASAAVECAVSVLQPRAISLRADPGKLSLRWR